MSDFSTEPIHRFAREAMGTIFEVMIADQEADYAAQASRAVFHEIAHLESLFSRFNATSDVGQINRIRTDESLRISPESFECLQAAEKIRRETAGAFNLNFRKSGKNADRPSFDLTADDTGFRLRIHRDLFRRPPAALDLDLGAIGKGYALDRAAILLAEWEVERFLIHGGTSTALAAGSAPGLPPGEAGWPVGVGGTWELTEIPHRVLLQDRALSGSGTEVKGQHVLDPRTGRRAGGHLAAWVSHPSAAVADALSTAFMAMNDREVRRYCRDNPDVWALLITPKGKARRFNREIIPA
jgi:thiamine biosynthesis lipoprotein